MIVVCVASILLIGASVFIFADYTQKLHNGAGSIAIHNSDEMAENFSSVIEGYKQRSENLAKDLLATGMQNEEDFSINLSRIIREEGKGIKFARYFKGGEEYLPSGTPFNTEYESKKVIVGSKMEVSVCVGIVEDRVNSISMVAFCIPLKGCPYADCLVLFYHTGIIDEVKAPENSDTKSRLTAICTSEGEIVSILENSDLDISLHNNIYEFLRKTINDKSTIDDVQTTVTEGRSKAYTVSANGHETILAVSGIREYGSSHFSVFSIYRASDLYNAAYSTFTTLLGILALSFALLIFVAGYFIVNFRLSERRIKNLRERNELLDCPTVVKFEKVANEIMARNKNSSFAVTVVDIRHFDYMTEHMGEEQMINELKRMRDFYTRFLQVEETFGYAENGRFVLLLHYRDKEALGQRIKMLSTVLGIVKITNSGERITLSAYGGMSLSVYSSDISAEKMLDQAIIAENATKYPYDFEAFRIYNERLHSSTEMTEYIEVNMQSALENKLFRVFYQPKYNIEGNRPDGCEALVRWYNPETDEYMQPGLFLPIFEENRFIVKLDKYVYEQVCIYMSETVAQHKTLYPISVNVSRITAAEPDFLSYYTAIKNKYNIADNFIMIEFTESSAFEDYERLRETVNILHKNGFKCSIDDFGSGFSSYNILKELPMDEIKLDRFFIMRGFSDERDLKVLSSVIQLGRGLNMKVTQEGVETKDQMDMLKKLGCNVIQGYYYSKPLVQGDYDDFLTRKFMN